MDNFNNWSISMSPLKNKKTGAVDYIAEYKDPHGYKRVVFSFADQYDTKNAIKPGSKSWLSKMLFGKPEE